MTFALTSKAALGESLVHVTASEIGELIDGGNGTEGPGLDERVHEARKSIKRLRALLRLYRGALAHTLFELEDSRLRELAHTLGGARDAVARRECLERLVEAAPTSDRVRLADHLGALTRALDDARHARPDEVAEALRAVHDGLGALRERARSWSLDRNGFPAIAAGFRRTYARGRRDLSRALHRPTEKRLHSFRIGVKRHQYQLTLLEPMWPEPIKAFRQEAQRLGELLGQDHDLSLLERRFEALVLRHEFAPLERSFANAANHLHSELRREAFDLGARVYAESPGRVLLRYREYFDAWV
jgi:CHAD domain-containing protein